MSTRPVGSDLQMFGQTSRAAVVIRPYLRLIVNAPALLAESEVLVNWLEENDLDLMKLIKLKEAIAAGQRHRGRAK